MTRLLLLIASFCVAYISDAQTKTDTTPIKYNEVFKPVKWRSIGPFRAGRSVAATGVVGDIKTYYMGTTGGGLWKTEDMGLTWSNISDGYFKTGSVGAIAVPETDPNLVYVGMGEHAIRGVMTHHGDGVYKSTDAGKTFKKMGLDATQHISRIVVDPRNPNVLLVGAQGALYSKSKERGIYKSTDGGQTWKNVLFVNDQTGCVELSMDMNNPRVIYAAMWEHGRKPWQIMSGGPGSGLYKSVDGGDTWERLTAGLPREMGKMSIAVCRSNSDKVYALIESDSEKDSGGVYLSNNAGKSWAKVTNDHRLIQRAWYYIELFTDPLNDQTIYVLSAPALRSTDGGKTWEELSGTHGDYHDLWINPKDSRNLIIADDGGAFVTFNGGKSWNIPHVPTAQFYRINVDNQFPYRIYGGQQDNSSVSIAHRELYSGGIGTSSWTSSAGGESAFLAFDPNDPRYVMGGSYQGTIEVLDMKAMAGTNVMAAPIQYLGMDAKDMKYRFNWNAPIIWSKYEPNTYYHGSQYLLKTTDRGQSWKEVSPDLTRNEKEKQGKPGVPYTNEAVGAENYGTLAYIAESPHEKGVIWTGSDDGLVYLTQDNGASWKNVTPKGLQECLINAIEVSPHDKATAYIATTRYKFNDHTPGLYKTTDYGKTWEKIVNGIPSNAFTRVVREDDVLKDLLFAGTELGLFISYDAGKNWSSFQLNLPVTPITDLRVHKGDLIAATSGRSFWILDDLALIRQFKNDKKETVLYSPKDTYITNSSSALNQSSATGVSSSRGVNPASGVVIYYQLPELKSDEQIEMLIKDAAGTVIRKFSSKADSLYKSYEGAPDADPLLGKQKGLNRFVWDLRHATVAAVPDVYIESSYAGHKAIPGTYSIELKVKGETISSKAIILANPLYTVTPATYTEYDALMRSFESTVSLMHKTINSLYAKRTQIDELVNHLPADASFAQLKKEADSLSKQLKAWDEDMVQRKSKAYDDVENFPNKFTANYMFMMNQAESDQPMITKPSLELKKQLDTQWQSLWKRAEDLNTQISNLNKKLVEKGIGPVWVK